MKFTIMKVRNSWCELMNFKHFSVITISLCIEVLAIYGHAMRSMVDRDIDSGRGAINVFSEHEFLIRFMHNFAYTAFENSENCLNVGAPNPLELGVNTNVSRFSNLFSNVG